MQRQDLWNLCRINDALIAQQGFVFGTKLIGPRCGLMRYAVHATDRARGFRVQNFIVDAAEFEIDGESGGTNLFHAQDETHFALGVNRHHVLQGEVAHDDVDIGGDRGVEGVFSHGRHEENFLSALHHQHVVRVVQNAESVGLIEPCLHGYDERLIRLQSVGGHTQGVTGKRRCASVALIS